MDSVTSQPHPAVESDEPGRPLRRDAARNRQLLLDAARDVFAKRGLDATLDDVARRAGVGVGTAYRHFPNKHDLARAVLAQTIDEVLERFEAACAIEDPREALTQVVENWACAQAQDRGLRDVLMGVHDDTVVEQIHGRTTAPLRSLLKRAKAAGVVRRDVGESDIGFLSMMLCAVADVSADAEPELWRRYVPMLMAGLAAPVKPPLAAMPSEEFRQALTHHKRVLRDATVVVPTVVAACPGSSASSPSSARRPRTRARDLPAD